MAGASVKFLLPFAVLTAVGALIPWPAPHSGKEPAVVLLADPWAARVMHPGAGGLSAPATVIPLSGFMLPALGVLWILGVLAVAVLVFSRWRRVRRAMRQSVPASVPFVIPVMWCPPNLAPAVVGILRPVLLLPQGIEPQLNPEQLRAVLAHERCHVAWRDNFAAASHILVEALFWFHPLVWWLGRRLVEERERACDEHVLAAGHRPESYAEGILSVCEHHIQARHLCAAGAGGANLRKRIEAIMNNQMIERLNGIQKLVLAAAACAAIAVPIAAGVLSSPQAYAQPGAPNTKAPEVSNGMWTPDFKDTEITMICQAVGVVTGKNFIIHPRISGQLITWQSAEPMPAEAYYQSFLSTLKEHGLNAEPYQDGSGRVIVIVPDTGASTGEWTPRFKNADILTVAGVASAHSGRNLLVDPRVRARVTMIAEAPMSPEASYQGFLSLIEKFGFKAETTGDVTTITLATGDVTSAAETWTPGFQNDDIMLVAAMVSAHTGRSFLMDPRVRATVTMMSNAPMSPDATYQAFLAMLEKLGFKAETAGVVTTILPAPAPGKT